LRRPRESCDAFRRYSTRSKAAIILAANQRLSMDESTMLDLPELLFWFRGQIYPGECIFRYLPQAGLPDLLDP
jgi:hypothetical protein